MLDYEEHTQAEKYFQTPWIGVRGTMRCARTGSILFVCCSVQLGLENTCAALHRRSPTLLINIVSHQGPERSKAE